MREHGSSPTDAELIAQAGSDAAAFRELYERYAAALYRYHRRCCGDPDAAHDLTAETFAQAWLALPRFRDEAGGSAAPWLYGIARNVLLMSVRRRRLERAGLRRLGLLNDAAAVTHTGTEPDASWLEQLEAALDELPPAQRQAIQLRFGQDLAYQEVAAALNTSTATARVRVHRALNALRSRLTQTSSQGT